MEAIEVAAPQSRADSSTKLAEFSVQASWPPAPPPLPPQDADELEHQLGVAEAAGWRVVKKYPGALRRLAD